MKSGVCRYRSIYPIGQSTKVVDAVFQPILRLITASLMSKLSPSRVSVSHTILQSEQPEFMDSSLALPLLYYFKWRVIPNVAY